MKAGFNGLALAAGAAVGAVYAVKGAFQFANEQADIEYTRQKFDRLSGAINTTGDALLGKLRTATRGTVSDLELVNSAADFLKLGLAKTEDQVVRLTRVSGALGMDMNQLVLTLANQTTMRFDQLGVSVDGFDNRLQTLKKSGMDTNAAFTEAFLQQAEAQIAKVGDVADTTAGKIKTANTAWANYFQTLKSGQGGGVTKWLIDVEIGAGDVAKGLTLMSDAVKNGKMTMGEGRLEFIRWVLGARDVKQTTFELENGLYGLDQAQKNVILTGKYLEASYEANKGAAEKARPAFQGYEEDLAKIGEDTKVGKLDVSGHLQALDELSKKYDGTLLTIQDFDKKVAASEALSIINQQFQEGLIDTPKYEELYGRIATQLGGLSGDQAAANEKMFEWARAVKEGSMDIPTLISNVIALDDAINHVPKEVQINFNLTTTGDIPNLGNPKGINGGKGTKTTGNTGYTGTKKSGTQEGYASGGSFTVGGGGGIDSQYVHFMATPGERVTVTPPGQGGGGGVHIENLNVLPPEGASPYAVARLTVQMLQNAQRNAANAGLGYAG